ncbi:hypothetical protein IFM89_006425 [Coptis chinensis]|uniref:Uncharacterized protein n=1 Tax=Coptis chinensis TaxID=261450 RepID=A0A835HTA5_9MAGN|nr:hypothetical protein IFM89_006425 [Coptis chinensis]
MKFDEASLTKYLVENLQPLTEADPVILAEYVAALLKKDKPVKELQNLCSEKLVEFLGQGTKSFIKKLFQALEDGTVVAPAKTLDSTGKVEPSSSLITEDQIEPKSSALNQGALSPVGGSDPDEKEVSDDDDDDRNHKHRRRETRSQSFDKDAPGQPFRQTNRKRNKPSENGQGFFRNDPQTSEIQREGNPTSLGRDLSARVGKKRAGLGPFVRTGFDLGLRAGLNQAFHGDPVTHFDVSTALGRLPTGRGRGRASGPWNQHDLKFSSAETLDFASQMPLLCPPPSSLFTGRGLHPFGMIPGMPNGVLDSLHPLGSQMNHSVGICIPHQRCRDFEERGFCLRGDMCPMEHGVNRIVVEDVQSLSQFNLPVSIPSSHQGGAGAVSAHTGGGPSSLQGNGKFSLSKNSKHGIGDDGFCINRGSSASAGAGEADLYDPDQPLWNNDHPERSSALSGLSSAKVDDAEPIWNGDLSDRHSFILSDGFDVEQSGRSIVSAVVSQNASSSVWGRIRDGGSKLNAKGNFDTNIGSMGYHKNETKQEKVLSSVLGATRQKKQFASEENGPKAMNLSSNHRLRTEPTHSNGRTSQKALRTLFVNGIPLKENKREALLSHFQKFGEIIDIYIPLNSEKAFVQFSKRDEAESALKAPDAVMGNRFVKLWWANRDSIPDNGLSINNTISAATQVVAASILPQSSVVDREKESRLAAVPKFNAAPLSDVPASTAVASLLVTNAPKVTLSQKKLDNLELLKEELRIKQEMLDKKRNDFRRQLNRLEKQAFTVQSEPTTEQAAKRHKVGMGTDIVKTATPSPINSITAECQPGSVKTVEKELSEESIVSPSSKTGATLVLQSPSSLKHPTRPSVPIGTVPVVSRFKLDNRPTTFRILPP